MGSVDEVKEVVVATAANADFVVSTDVLNETRSRDAKG